MSKLFARARHTVLLCDALKNCRLAHARNVLDNAFSEDDGNVGLILVQGLGHRTRAAWVIRPFCKVITVYASLRAMCKKCVQPPAGRAFDGEADPSLFGHSMFIHGKTKEGK
jgi:hypothetical protein